MTVTTCIGAPQGTIQREGPTGNVRAELPERSTPGARAAGAVVVPIHTALPLTGPPHTSWTAHSTLGWPSGIHDPEGHPLSVTYPRQR